MHPTRVLHLLLVASVAQASWFNFRKPEPRDGLIRRQSGDPSEAATSTEPAETTTSADPETTTTTTSAAAAPTTTSTTTAEEQTTSAAAPTSTPEAPAPTSTTPTSAAPTTLQTSTTPAGGNEETSTSAAATSAAHSTTAKPVTSTIRTVITMTNSEGVATSFTSEATVTSTPGLNEASSGGSSSGMSAQTRNTVIGVVVGVGGAIVLGALGFVAFRIWGRKKQAEENDGLMEYNNQYGNEPKPEVGNTQPTGRTPFQSTLETYHAPSHQVNASSNF